MWEIDEAGEFEAGDVVKVLGEGQPVQRKAADLKVTKIRRAAPDE